MGLKSESTFLGDFLRQCGGYAVIDGGLATELERHGADLNDSLWSAKCLVSSPHLIRRVRYLLCLVIALIYLLFFVIQLSYLFVFVISFCF